MMFNNDEDTSLLMVGVGSPIYYHQQPSHFHHRHSGMNVNVNVMLGSPFHHHQQPYHFHHRYSGMNVNFNVNAYKQPPSPMVPMPSFAHPQHAHHLYHQPQRTIEIIQLEEVPPPPRERISVPSSSSCASSSYTSSSSSSEHPDNVQEEEEEEGVESYCSSEECTGDEDENEPTKRVTSSSGAGDSYSARMRRIEQWRETYAKAVGAEFAPSPTRSKRKSSANEENDALSHSSKRSRHASTSAASHSSRGTSVHSCSACDACFPDRGSLHRHGLDERTNEACRAAVEYDFEQ